MNFGEAIENLKKSRLVQRTSWAAQGMHIYLEDSFGALLGKGGGMEHRRMYSPVIIMYEHDKIHHPGWTPSIADMLADDWQLTDGNYTVQDDSKNLIVVDDATEHLDFEFFYSFFTSGNIKGYASFSGWAEAWFTPDNLDCLIPLNVVVWSIKRLAYDDVTLRQIRAALKAWCVAKGYELNPPSLRDQSNRIMRRYQLFTHQEGGKNKPGKWVATDAFRVQECIYIMTPGQAEPTERYWTPTPTK